MGETNAFDAGPDFNRLRCALKRGQPDRVPLAELLVDVGVKEAFLGRPITSPADEVEFWQRAGYDFVPVFMVQQDNLWTPDLPPKEGLRISRSRRSLYAEQEEDRRWRSERAAWITCPEDMESFPWPKDEDFDLSLVEAVIPFLPPNMQAIAITSLHEWVVHVMGTETFLVATVEQPELVREVYRRVGERIVHWVDLTSRIPGVGGLWVGDDLAYTAGMFYSPAQIREWLFPWYREIAAIARSRDLPLIFHSDGDVRPIIPDLVDIGFDALHPIEPKAMDIVEIKREWGQQLCIIGNIDLSYTLPRGTPQEVEVEVKERLRQCAPGGGYCVSSANSITEYVPVANYRAMVEATLRWGKYPIQV